MGMKICTLCGKSLARRKRLVNPDKNGMRCKDCDDEDIVPAVEAPAVAEGPVTGKVAIPNYVTKKPPKPRHNQKVTQIVNGEPAKAKHYARKKKKKMTYPVIEEKVVKKHDKGKSST
jgi:hypothetical protein